MMLHATMQVAGSIARRVGTGVLSITLDKLPAARARGSARYIVTMAADAVGGGESVRFVDARGYVRGLTLQEVGGWLEKYLSGEAIAVHLRIPDASSLPAQWTPARMAAMDARLAALDPQAMRAEAAAKTATVQGWADSGRRTAVIEAAGNMVQCAELVEWLDGTANEWPGTGVPDESNGGGGRRAE